MSKGVAASADTHEESDADGAEGMKPGTSHVAAHVAAIDRELSAGATRAPAFGNAKVAAGGV